LIYKLVIILTNNFWSLKLVVNDAFSCSVREFQRGYIFASTLKDLAPLTR